MIDKEIRNLEQIANQARDAEAWSRYARAAARAGDTAGAWYGKSRAAYACGDWLGAVPYVLAIGRDVDARERYWSFYEQQGCSWERLGPLEFFMKSWTLAGVVAMDIHADVRGTVMITEWGEPTRFIAAIGGRGRYRNRVVEVMERQVVGQSEPFDRRPEEVRIDGRSVYVIAGKKDPRLLLLSRTLEMEREIPWDKRFTLLGISDGILRAYHDKDVFAVPLR